MWFTANLLFEGVHPGQPRSENLWEERIVLFNAPTEDEARHQAESLGKAEEHCYVAATNEPVQWRFRQIERLTAIESDVLQSGTELCSRFLRASEVQSLQSGIHERETASHALTSSQ